MSPFPKGVPLDQLKTRGLKCSLSSLSDLWRRKSRLLETQGSFAKSFSSALKSSHFTSKSSQKRRYWGGRKEGCAEGRTRKPGLFWIQERMAEPNGSCGNRQQSERYCNECDFSRDFPQLQPLGFAKQCPEVSRIHVLEAYCTQQMQNTEIAVLLCCYIRARLKPSADASLARKKSLCLAQQQCFLSWHFDSSTSFRLPCEVFLLVWVKPP